MLLGNRELFRATSYLAGLVTWKLSKGISKVLLFKVLWSRQIQYQEPSQMGGRKTRLSSFISSDLRP